MLTSESLEVFSDILLQDERIVSLQEREFLADLIRYSQNNPNQSEPRITQAIARLASEVVLQRAGGLVGERVLRKLIAQDLIHRSSKEEDFRPDRYADERFTCLPPKPPIPSPPSPGPKMYRSADYNDLGATSSIADLPPKPPTPSPPSPGMARPLKSERGPKGILGFAGDECTELVPPRCVVLEEFLAPGELEDLLAYAIAHQKDFVVSEVISPGVNAGSAVDFEYRRSRVLMDLGPHHRTIVNRLSATLPRILPRLGLAAFPVSRVETQITASHNGDFFRWHTDNGQDEVAARKITFVYFFHREPKAFEGGELRIQGISGSNAANGSGNYYTIVPRQNQAVLFESSLTHEITPVKSLSDNFADARFTLNGWFSRSEFNR